MIVGKPSAALLDSLARLHAAAFSDGPRPWSAAEIGALAAPPAGCLVVDDARAPSAFLLMRCAADEAELLTVAVEPARWNQGLARALLADGEGWCRGRGVARVFLDVSETNLRARRLYARQGFETVGHRRGYFGSGPGAAAIVMVKVLDTPNCNLQ